MFWGGFVVVLEKQKLEKGLSKKKAAQPGQTAAEPVNRPSRGPAAIPTPPPLLLVTDVWGPNVSNVLNRPWSSPVAPSISSVFNPHSREC